MDINHLNNLLDQFKNNQIDKDAVLDKLKALPFEDLNFAKIDHHRAIRTGFPEVIFCQGKTDKQILEIFKSLSNKNDNILLTRVESSTYQKLKKMDDRLRYNKDGKVVLLESNKRKKIGQILIISAGTADMPIAEEAAETAQICGAKIERIYDAGVAGIHRLLSQYQKIQKARCIVVIAGMEGALPSVVGGLASCPIIAVPTSVGYGAHFHGLAALLTMLNSCASNITVVNIDNGFGAGFNASLINKDRD